MKLHNRPETALVYCCCDSSSYACRWHGTVIEVFEMVILPEPYTVEACTFKDGCEANATIMERVRAVLEAELQRLDAPAATA